MHAWLWGKRALPYPGTECEQGLPNVARPPRCSGTPGHQTAMRWSKELGAAVPPGRRSPAGTKLSHRAGYRARQMNGLADADPAGAARDTSYAIRNVYCARALRDFGDGFVAVLLP